MQRDIQACNYNYVTHYASRCYDILICLHWLHLQIADSGRSRRKANTHCYACTSTVSLPVRSVTVRAPPIVGAARENFIIKK